jgi:hypothetical protein
VIVASSGVALAFNGLRPIGMPLLAPEPYQILIPCPEPGGPVVALAVSDPAVISSASYLVDSRSEAEYQQWHLAAAVHVPFDWLDPLPEARLGQLARDIAASGATKVVVYGDGGRPDSGEFLGREISGRGIRHVHYVEGGAPALLQTLEAR